MPDTYEPTPKKTRSINACVSEDFYTAFAKKAAEVPGRTPTEYARELLEHAVYQEPSEIHLLAEVRALRRLVVKGLIDVNRPTSELGIKTLIYETDRDKLAKARELRKLDGPR